MPDSITFRPDGGNTVELAADKWGERFYPIVKVSFGSGGAAVSDVNPLPVAIVSGGGGGSSGGLTDTQLRASAVPVSGPLTDTQLRNSPLSVTFTNSTLAVTGPLTDTQIRATALPVSGTVTANAGTGNFAITAAALPLPSGAATETTLAAVNTKTPALGQAVMASSSPVVIASNQSVLPVSGPLTDTQLRSSAVPVSIAATLNVTFTNSSLAVTGPLTDAQLRASAVPVSGTVTITPPTLTKGTQGATGLSTQDLKDAGRAIVNAATAIAGVTAVTTEALLALNVSRDGAATASVTTIAVTSGKRLRIIGVIAGVISTAAAVISSRVSLRMNPSGAAAANSPILATLCMSQQAAALAQAGDTCVLMFPEAIEISGTMQVGLSQIASVTTGTIWASLIAYEY